VSAEAEQVESGLWKVLAPNPSPMTGRGTNSYVVGGDDVVVVDPGPDDPRHLDALLGRAGDGIRYVVVTHAHLDHAAGARRLTERVGATLLGPPPAEGFAPDAVLADGDVVAVPGWRLEAVETPGHCAHHLCFVLERTPAALDASPEGDGERREAAGVGGCGGTVVPGNLRPSRKRILLSGDHVLGGSPTVIAAPGGDMAAYLASLGRIRALDPPIDSIAPGHGPIVDDPRAALDEYVAHRLEREEEVVVALARLSRATPAQIAAVVYPALEPGLGKAATLQVWAHLRKLGDEGRAWSADPGRVDAQWSSV